jgi:hypothetical protein
MVSYSFLSSLCQRLTLTAIKPKDPSIKAKVATVNPAATSGETLPFMKVPNYKKKKND